MEDLIIVLNSGNALKMKHLSTFELVCTMTGAKGNCETIHTGLLDKYFASSGSVSKAFFSI